MVYILDLFYVLILALLAPFLLRRRAKTGRYRRLLLPKLLGTTVKSSSQKPYALFHGVSVGEVHLLEPIIRSFLQHHSGWGFYLSTSTDAGYDEACRIFGIENVCAAPFDFTWAVKRTLFSMKPKLIVLAESDLWPNFLTIANQVKIPVVVVNGRISPRSAKRYQLFKSILYRLLLRKVTHFCMQSEHYTQLMAGLGVCSNRLTITGSVKYDRSSVVISPDTLGRMRQELGIHTNQVVFVAGSTHAPEEEICLQVFQNLLAKFNQLRLILVPRSPERFVEVEHLIRGAGFECQLRTQQFQKSEVYNKPVILINRMGELGTVWALADVAFVGGSLCTTRGGQSMIEPAGLGIPLVFGPHTWNFRDAVNGLLHHNGAVVVHDQAELAFQLEKMLTDRTTAAAMGANAKNYAHSQLGATHRTVEVLTQIVEESQ
ncbi:MAG: 3-deoxy-D-manno-octulosonic acid transferase [Zavarzinella sp.]